MIFHKFYSSPGILITARDEVTGGGGNQQEMKLRGGGGNQQEMKLRGGGGNQQEMKLRGGG